MIAMPRAAAAAMPADLAAAAQAETPPSTAIGLAPRAVRGARELNNNILHRLLLGCGHNLEDYICEIHRGCFRERDSMTV
jgi:hypothetical protein